MKRTKVLALVLAVSVMLMGAGYAAWTDQTQIESTVSTGNLNVDVRWANLTRPDYTGGSITGGLNSNQDPNKIVVNITDLYPTVYNGNDSKTFARIHFSVENKGTVPVKLDSVEFVPTNPTSPAWDYLKTVIHIHKGIPSATGTSLATQTSLTGVNAIGMFQDKYLKDMKSLLEGSDLATTILMPGEAIWFGGNTEEESSIRIWLDKDAPNDTTELQNLGFTLKLNWKQYNM